jgi:DNA polymerase III epsilon subunit-like protein
MKYLLALDLETTGLDPNYHEITQIAFIILDKRMNEVMEYQSYVSIDHPERGTSTDFNVFEYTGIDPKILKEAPALPDILEEISWKISIATGRCKKEHVVIFGQNPQFDYNFLREAYRKADCLDLFNIDYHVIGLDSIWTFTYLCRKNNFPKKLGLKYMCDALGIKNEKEHDAMSDIRTTVEIFKKLLQDGRNEDKNKICK